MPNHVQNRVRLIGEQSRIDELLRTVQNDEEGFGSIDFNKIIPMPKEMEIECGTQTDKGFKAYSDFIAVYILGQQDGKIDVFAIPESSEKAFLRIRKDIDPETWSLGKQAYQNKIKFGHTDWYSWCIDNWGTKWNAYYFGEYESNTLTFCTAWSRIMPIMTKLSEMFPDVHFNYAWADEDFGCNVGEVELQNGETTFENIPAPFSKEAYEMAADIRGEDLLADRHMVFSEETGTYERLSDEEIDSLSEGEISESGESGQSLQSV
ncbi:MAG: hypothetical protein IK093_19690 [Ruminiclostridium sp.]|nr:hypothetical protein [Ruminiclostridium sp.]